MNSSVADERNVSATRRKTRKVVFATEKRNTTGIVLKIFLLVTCLKILLIPTYRSTDFEVHRNWLAITHSLPIEEWYVNAKSQWTLDYPPLFAWFECMLGQAARFADPEMLRVENLDYASSNTILFQRGSVILLDVIFAYGVKKLGEVFCGSPNDYAIFVTLSLCNVGLLVVDHIHFQYNGFLLGIFLLAVANVSKINREASVLQGALWFALLLNMKHIYLYVAPAFAIWLLRSYCMNGGSFVKRLLMLASIVVVVVAISFGPFVSQMPQVLSRLFPFKRGLVHAYWAANAWALYIGVDKILSMIFKQLGWIEMTKSAVMTGGLVQEQSFLLLPTPTPFVTFLLTVLSIMPALYCLLFRKDCNRNPKQFVRCLILCALGSFIFGWHVHEKAILTAVVPLCALAVTDKEDARIFLILSNAGHTALLPLLHPSNLAPLKILLLLVYMIASSIALSRKFQQQLLYYHEYVYVISLPLLTVYETTLHKLVFGGQLPFLPLAVTSIYCAIGVLYCWVFYYSIFLRSQNDLKDKKRKTE